MPPPTPHPAPSLLDHSIPPAPTPPHASDMLHSSSSLSSSASSTRSRQPPTHDHPQHTHQLRKLLLKRETTPSRAPGGSALAMRMAYLDIYPGRTIRGVEQGQDAPTECVFKKFTADGKVIYA